MRCRVDETLEHYSMHLAEMHFSMRWRGPYKSACILSARTGVPCSRDRSVCPWAARPVFNTLQRSAIGRREEDHLRSPVLFLSQFSFLRAAWCRLCECHASRGHERHIRRDTGWPGRIEESLRWWTKCFRRMFNCPLFLVFNFWIFVARHGSSIVDVFSVDYFNPRRFNDHF